MGVDRYFEAQAEKRKAHWERELIKELKAEREKLFEDRESIVNEWMVSRLNDVILFLEQRWEMG